MKYKFGMYIIYCKVRKCYKTHIGGLTICFNHCSIFRSDDDECIFSRKLILEYINEEMRFILLTLISYSL